MTYSCSVNGGGVAHYFSPLLFGAATCVRVQLSTMNTHFYWAQTQGARIAYFKKRAVCTRELCSLAGNRDIWNVQNLVHCVATEQRMNSSENYLSNCAMLPWIWRGHMVGAWVDLLVWLAPWKRDMWIWNGIEILVPNQFPWPNGLVHCYYCWSNFSCAWMHTWWVMAVQYYQQKLSLAMRW